MKNIVNIQRKSKIERFTNKCIFMINGTRKEPHKVIKIMS